MTLSEIIQNYLRENNMSQRELAKKCDGVSHSYIYTLIAGINPATGKPIVPRLDKLRTVASAMGMTLHELLDMADDMPVEIRNRVGNDMRIDPIITEEDIDSLEALHQNPKLRMLFDRQRQMSEDDINFMLSFANRILKERDGE